MGRIPSWMKEYGLLVLRSANRAADGATFVVALICLGVAYFALGDLASRPVPSNLGPAMRSSYEMGNRLGQTFQWVCLGLGVLFIVGAFASRGFRDR